MLGPKFILFGSLVSAITLSLFLYSISVGSAIPVDSEAMDSQSAVNGQPVLATKIDHTSNETPDAGISASESDTGCRVSAKFPDSILQWCDLITRYADKRGLEPDLVAALIWQESGGKPQAYSSSGAVGLMQVMPSDGLSASFMCVNGPCFSNRPTINELEDPEFNIAYGTKMLAGLRSRTGDLREALKSYGPMNVGYSYADKVIGIYQKYGER